MMTKQEFEALLIEYKATDRDSDRADPLLEQIADAHDSNPEMYDALIRAHNVHY